MNRALITGLLIAALAVAGRGGSNSATSLPTGNLGQTVPAYLINTGTTDSGRVVVKDDFAITNGVGGAQAMIVDATGTRLGPSETNVLAGRIGAAQLANASTSTTVTFSTPMPDDTYHVSVTSTDLNVGLPAAARVSYKTAAGFGLYYTAAAEETDITYAASDY